MNVLAILMRNDMESLNAGKACAQAAHAADALRNHIHNICNVSDINKGRYSTWQRETEQGFGTVLVYAMPMRVMCACLVQGNNLGLVSSEVTDPTYPIRDGKVTHHICLTTCGYLFGPEEVVGYVLRNAELMP